MKLIFAPFPQVGFKTDSRRAARWALAAIGDKPASAELPGRTGTSLIRPVRRFLFAAVIFCASMLQTLSAASANPLRDAPQMSAWLAKAQVVLSDLYRILDYTDQMDQLSTALLEGGISEDFASRSAAQLALQARIGLRSVENQLQCCLEIPDLETQVFSKAARDTRQYLVAIKNQVADFVEESEAMLAAAQAADGDAAGRLLVKKLDRYNVLLSSENVLMSSQRMLVKQSHPQHYLFTTIIASNNAIIALVSHIGSVASSPHQADAGYAGSQVERNLQEALVAIDDGRQRVSEWFRTIGRLSPANDNEARMLDVVEKIFANYETSFDVEEEIVAGIEKMSQAAIGGPLDFVMERFEGEADRIQVYVGERMTLQAERTFLLGSMGGD